MPDLSRYVAIHNGFRKRLALAYGLDKNDEAVVDTATGETALEDVLVQALREAHQAEVYAEANKAIIEDVKARKARLEAKSEAIRRSVAWALQESGMTRIVAPDITVTLSAGRSKLIINETDLPSFFLRTITTYKPDRDAIQEAVDRGDVPNGVEISNGEPVLTVRRK